MNGFDPGQREHELADAVLSLLIAASRYSDNDTAARPTPDRLARLERITLLIANEVGERVRTLRGIEAGQQFRKALARRAPTTGGQGR